MAVAPEHSRQESPATRPARLPLGRTRRRLSFERRLRVWLLALGAPGALMAAALLWRQTSSPWLTATLTGGFAAVWATVASVLFEQVTRPLQTLSNVVAALREDDYSFRARGARRGDSLGDLALEINALAGTLQAQRTAARDAVTMVERVLVSMQSPVLAFDAEGRLRLVNAAARTAFHLPAQAPEQAIGQTAGELALADLLLLPDQGLYTPAGHAGQLRWSVRRTVFRLHGLPHTLLVLADVAAVLREEERTAWQRLIRVLGHEINNSLTPIQSIAGSLRSRLTRGTPEQSVPQADLQRGLGVIEDRAASLNRFLQAYQQLTRLPAPRMRPAQVGPMVRRVALLEQRLTVQVRMPPEAGESLEVLCDPDQIEQVLINLLRNAAEAALSMDGLELDGASAGEHTPSVTLRCFVTEAEVILEVEDNGPGITNTGNLFVPFYTTKSGGSGIGLVLSQQVATAHRGTVLLKNRVSGRGAVARLILPLG